MSTYFLNWQDPENRAWYPVGKLFHTQDLYIFAYTKGSLRSSNFVTFGNLNDKNAVYVSNELFPIFANRVMNSKRPDYQRYASWAGLDSQEQSDSLKLMARMGGGKATDNLQVYQVPERDCEDRYRTVFFAHGLSHLPSESQCRAQSLIEGQQVYPLLDIQNPYDRSAVAIRSQDPSSLIGYCPRYLARDINKLVKGRRNNLVITIKKVNEDAPPQFMLLCEAVGHWPLNFEPCSSPDHKTIVDLNLKQLVEKMGKNNSY
ncbi:HIRAN domain-containing protein [Pseudochrobactrum sp. sp1633]|uniref:HIRAN domain-containing protein n=1 Tax=Pseudochrobactrum sp. sp1633 TaxID=3036706 RepID=UPI0025A664A2|nr:HIRAN domain-containing protein [Pseudochrobactrum sp. sp1633]MDM8346031.1 HIRAN domain-containing protein [Pseudochrobactrum sp. sp1633]